jgi:glycosyltransferase involved in cell wall biosynthesis
MNVLYLTSGMPFPPHSGGQLQQFEDLKRLSASADVHLRVVSTSFEADTAGCAAMERCCASVELFAATPGSTAAPSGGLPERVRQHQCPALCREIADLLAAESIDVIHVQGYYLVQHLPADNRVPLLLFEENIEYLLDRHRHQFGLTAATEPSWTVSRQFEHAAWRRATICGAVCEDDMRQMLADLPGLRVRLLPNGWDHLRGSGERHREANGGQRVGFLGNYAWPPSEDAAVFLLERLWPRIRDRVGAAQLVLVGTEPSPRMLELARHDDRVVITGTIPSVAPLLWATDVFLCPLRVGGGVRLKMIEALSSGCAVVSTSVGAQGLPTPMRDALVVADTPEELVDQTVALLGSAQARRELGARAAAIARRLPSWDDAAELVWQCWSELTCGRLER